MRKIVTLCFITALFFQCEKSKESPIADPYQIMESCRENALKDEISIRSGLRGDWTLIHFDCGFCIPPDEMPQAEITFSPDSGQLRWRESPGDTLQVVDFSWTLEPNQNSSGPSSVFQLKTKPSHPALNCDIFCSDHMFYDDTPFDGLLFLYEKN
ncbi:MAG: hypothetical protein R3275_12100 [Saprospiraceae bacterium]|nr:hypothetical protein [Saprospiraceae bacterium]